MWWVDVNFLLDSFFLSQIKWTHSIAIFVGVTTTEGKKKERADSLHRFAANLIPAEHSLQMWQGGDIQVKQILMKGTLPDTIVKVSSNLEEARTARTSLWWLWEEAWT